MRRTSLVIILLIAIFSIDVNAQQRPVISQYMLNGLTLNPAYAARHQYSSFSVMYRDQWVNIPGAPKLMTASAQTGFKGRKLGLGLLLGNDAVGVHDNIFLYGSYAYAIEMRNGGKLAMGVQAGFDNLRSDFNKLELLDENDPQLQGVMNKFMPNFGAGIFYHDEHNYFGVSVPYILSNRRLESEEFYRKVKLARYYYITGGKVFELNERVVVKPSGLIRIQDENPIAFDVNVNVYLDEIIGVGASYRFGDSVIGIFEFQVSDFIKFSYAYDWVLSDLTEFTRGTHELMLNYRINFAAPRKHRMCPGPLYF